MSNDATNNEVNELVGKVSQFLRHQISSSNQLSVESKESLAVAAECIEQAYRIPAPGVAASNDLLEIYRSHKRNANQATDGAGGASGAPGAQRFDFVPFLQLLTSAFQGSGGGNVASANSQNANTQQEQPQQANASAAQTQSESNQPTAPRAPKLRKIATEAEKIAAESFKNQGNDFMKQNMFKEAYDCYTQAIDIDDNNAIYYSNRAAALSKLGDNQAALRDCEEALEVDSTYSKAYGRMGLAYANLDNHEKSRDAYVKAVELDPTNEGYKNNLKIAEENLAARTETNTSSSNTNAGNPMADNVVNMLRSMMSNPEMMQMAMRGLQDPRVQGLFRGNAAGNQQQTPPTTATNAGQTESSNQSATNNGHQNSQTTQNANTQQDAPAFNPADLLNMTSRLAGSANIDLFGAGQQFLGALGQNPNLLNGMEQMLAAFSQPPRNPNNQDNNSGNPPPGYS